MSVSVALATRSKDKAREIRQILSSVPGLRLFSLDDLGIAPSAEEDELEEANTFAEIATAKARYYVTRTGMIALADDSGLEVDALDGRPGVRTKRFSGRSDLSGLALDQANNEKLLEELHGVPPAQRTARYVCAAALALPNGPVVTAVGTCEGRIAEVPVGHGGFGYDPIFFLPDLGLTMAQVSAGQKNSRSHRGRAFRALIPHLTRIANP